MFPKIGVPQNGWFIINGKPYEQMDDLGGVTGPMVPLFLLETPEKNSSLLDVFHLEDAPGGGFRLPFGAEEISQLGIIT